MRHLILPLVCLGLALAGLAIAGSCEETPECVLVKLEDAYSRADIVQLELLMTEDYEFVDSKEETRTRDRELVGVRGLFLANAVSLSFVREFCISEGPERDTWILERIPVILDFKPHGQVGSPRTVRRVVSLHVRRTPDGRVRVYRWEEHAV